MRILTTSLLTLILILTGCMKGAMPSIGFEVIDGSGNTSSETRDVANFNAVSLADDSELVLTQDGTESLTIEADDNILPAIETEVRNSTLYIEIRDKTDLRPVTPIRYTLSTANFKQIELLGDGSIRTGTLESEKLGLQLHGDGRITVPEAVVANKVSIDIVGDGNVTVNALTAQELATNISGDGQVTVAGEVEVQLLTISGDGNFAADELRSKVATLNVSGDSGISVRVAAQLLESRCPNHDRA